ncbi:MAG: TetR/AcrR family transcriptional regulator [Gallintestinimicrobium sp.]
MATSLSEPTKKRILQVCVKLFLEQGYKKTTMAEIIEKSSVSSSSFQNIFRAKDGVLTELVQFMFENQFSMARSAASTKLPPVYVYAVETAIQMTLTELNENLREIYVKPIPRRKPVNIFSAKQPKSCIRFSDPISRSWQRVTFTSWRSDLQASCEVTWRIRVMQS